MYVMTQIGNYDAVYSSAIEREPIAGETRERQPSSPMNRVLKNIPMGRLFKNVRMQGAQKLKERGVYEKYVERGDCQRNAEEVRFSTAH